MGRLSIAYGRMSLIVREFSVPLCIAGGLTGDYHLGFDPEAVIRLGQMVSLEETFKYHRR